MNKLLSFQHPVIPNTENYKFAKTTNDTRLYGWVMSQPRELKAITHNGAVLWTNGKNEGIWHKEYRGEGGYAVASGSLTTQYAYSKVVANPTEKLIFWRFDGLTFREKVEE